MYATVQRWGNSQGIRIPKALLESLGIRENDRVELTQTGDSITLRKAVSVPHKTLEERLTAFYGVPVEQLERQNGDLGILAEHRPEEAYLLLRRRLLRLSPARTVPKSAARRAHDDAHGADSVQQAFVEFLLAPWHEVDALDVTGEHQLAVIVQLKEVTPGPFLKKRIHRRQRPRRQLARRREDRKGLDHQRGIHVRRNLLRTMMRQRRQADRLRCAQPCRHLEAKRPEIDGVAEHERRSGKNPLPPERDDHRAIVVGEIGIAEEIGSLVGTPQIAILRIVLRLKRLDIGVEQAPDDFAASFRATQRRAPPEFHHLLELIVRDDLFQVPLPNAHREIRRIDQLAQPRGRKLKQHRVEPRGLGLHSTHAGIMEPRETRQRRTFFSHLATS